MAEAIDKKIKQDIVLSLGLGEIKSSEQDKIINELLNIISTKINIAILDRLIDSEKKDLEKISKSFFVLNKDKKIEEYIKSKIHNIPELTEKITKETVNAFKDAVGGK